MKKIVEKFRIGGNPTGPSMPSAKLQRAIGSVIGVDIINHTLSVPTDVGIKVAAVGDTIICYDDNSYDVEKAVMN